MTQLAPLVRPKKFTNEEEPLKITRIPNKTKPYNSTRRTESLVVNLKAYTSFRALSRACATLRHTTKTGQKPVRASFNSASQALFINKSPLYTSNMASLDDKSRSLIQKAYPEAIQAEADMIKLSSTMFPKAEVQ
jgi:hypothetical protein